MFQTAWRAKKTNGIRLTHPRTSLIVRTVPLVGWEKGEPLVGCETGASDRPGGSRTHSTHRRYRVSSGVTAELEEATTLMRKWILVLAALAVAVAMPASHAQQPQTTEQIAKDVQELKAQVRELQSENIALKAQAAGTQE